MNEIEDLKNQGKLFLSSAAIILALWGVWSTFYTVQPDEEAVLIRFGKYVGTYPPGLHFKLPFSIDRQYIVKTKLVHRAEFGFRTRGMRNNKTIYSRGGYDKESLMLTGDLNVAVVQWVVLYQIKDPYKFLFKAKNPVITVRDVSESIMRRVIGDRRVSDVLTTARAAISLEAKDLMQDVLDRYDIGIKVKSVKLQDVNPPNLVRPSFNEVNEAKQEQEKVINQAEKEYNRVIPEARGKAEKVISKANGYAEALINRSLGDARRFEKLYMAYKESPKITKRRLYIETFQKMMENAENMTIIDSNLKGLIPVLNKERKQ